MSKPARRSAWRWSFGLWFSAFIRHSSFPSGGLLFAVFIAGVVVDEVDPDFAVFELLFVDGEGVHVTGAGGGKDPVAVELEAAGVAGTLEALAVGGVGNEAAGVGADGVEALDLVSATAEIDRADGLVGLAV